MVLKNKILKILNFIAMFILMLSISAMDSKDITIPVIGIAICMAWLLIYYEFNKCFT